ncbi:response regulator [Thalassospira mesophila]|uniref:Response regulatory domain-containing protein n=1 Tax=Thalassospira mesophila TaxID=1293891 RepID=A0A1Y2KV41_9PROT|nr:response regulator [Thalassospira mesophila]OSQ35568.1 hypothetical protein TMES_20815 [Thalassospira mesophila]
MRENINVLILEDEPITRSLLKSLLHKEGYTVSVTSSYDEATAAWQRASYDLIMADFFLEGAKTGADFLREVRAAGSKIPAIALSIADGPKNLADIENAGFDCYLPKPIDMKVLSEAVAKLLAAV